MDLSEIRLDKNGPDHLFIQIDLMKQKKVIFFKIVSTSFGIRRCEVPLFIPGRKGGEHLPVFVIDTGKGHIRF